MKSFREAYKKEVDRIPVPVITMEQIADEKRRKKIIAYRKHRRMMAVASAACVFLLCTAGAVAAAGYARGVIEVDEYGFRTADAETALLNETIAETNEESGLMIADAGDYAEREYFSYKVFREAEQIPFAIPEFSLLGTEIVSEHYSIFGDEFLMVWVETDKGLFTVNQTDYGNTLGHASSTVYPEGVCNEREYVTSQGFTWVVVDSNEAEDGIIRIHAAISVGDYELIVNFNGYTEEEAYSILDAMDLTLYL